MSAYMLCLVLTLVLTSNAFMLKCSAAEDTTVGEWMKWSRWSTCTEQVYCLEGTRERYRDCELGKRCVGIEAESDMCPNTSCKDRPLVLDVAHAEPHSFIAEECKTSKKFHVSGKFGYMMKHVHNILSIFPRGETMIKSCYFNVKVTAKTLPEEKDIYRYCFEPEDKKITLNDFKRFVTTGSLRFKYTSLQCPFKPHQSMYVTGFALGFQDDGSPYGLYIQVKGQNGFKTTYYRHMPGLHSSAYHLIWY